ncbi:uncharacterized protein LOC131073514 [Cryptomeria japonica]|uniref:uncharacterized protein LOC131073514 n=1 Tax=Cryptomeria japonica TaxID=3369 RepID=UPI0025ACADEB|nr:uncharacterized protein LOC131073514 [Cryptomeria japonica]XP_057865938.1 uncharacterized protein LOC131073514 [Cryptomeria japonica]XP_057865939.1 uncharacterized protein LOC131073514 [Cryptomeria japonica]
MENEGSDQNGASPSANNHSGELSSLASKFAEAEKTAGAFDYQNKTLENRVSVLLDEIVTLKEEKQSVLSQKEELEIRLAVLNGEFESSKDEKGKLLLQNEEIRRQLTEEIDRLGRLLSEKDNFETQLQNEKTQLQYQNEAIESQVCGLLSEKEEFLSKLKEVEVLRKENEELREEISALNTFENDTLGNLINEKEALVTELMDMKGELERLKNENGSLQDRLVESLKKVSDIEEENASLQGQLSGMKEENVSLPGQLSDVTTKALVLEDGHSKVAGDILAENSHLKSENAILQKNMENIGAESQRQLNALEEEHSRLQQEKEKQRKEIDLLHTMKSCIEQEKVSLGKKLEEASRELEVVGGDRQQINNLENQLKIVSSEKKDLEDVNLNLENEVKRLALAVEEQDKLKARIREFEVNFEAVKIALESKDNTIQQLTSELKSLQHSPEAKQKRSLLWPALLASGSLGVAAAFGYLKFSKHH